MMHLYSINDALFGCIQVSGIDDTNNVVLVALQGSYSGPKDAFTTTTCITLIN
jgi:hypothetical protein